jgi:hypothetical protein
MTIRQDATMEEILQYVQELSRSLGVRRSIGEVQKEAVREKFKRREFAKCVAIIRRCFGQLPNIRIIYENDHPLVERVSVKKSSEREWESVRQALENEKREKIRQLGGWTFDRWEKAAKIGISDGMPLYGSRAYYEYTLDLQVPKRLLFLPFEVFIVTIAHEMAHVLLFSLYSPLRKSEVATDLLTMVFGFDELMRICREQHNMITGYLSDEQFYKAYGAIIYERQV